MAGTTTDAAKPTVRDVVLGTDNPDYVRNDFLQDMVRLHRVLFVLQQPPSDKDDESPSDGQIDAMVVQMYTLLTEGKDYHLAGVRHVPAPSLSGAGGRIFQGLEEGGKGKPALKAKAAKALLAQLVRDEWTKPLDGVNLQESPYPECRALLERYPVEDSKDKAAATTTTLPDLQPTAKDAILIHATEGRSVADRVQEHELGNKVLFNMAAQLVTTYCTTPSKRVQAALALLHSLDDAQVVVQNPLTPQGAEAPVPPPGSKARFLVRTVSEDERSSYTLLDAATAASFALAFVFEVYLEKGMHLPPEVSAAIDPATLQPSSTPTTDHAPTDFDVLFGRGGLTNAHPGNRRFRDVISLHRPDYIRAIKMDKPAVARRIVRSIRKSTSAPGRFLKKQDDGQWYDVGDRTAAEKTSQGLRERSNAEKRQRHALREALRIRKQDMPEDGDTKAAAAPAPLPILNYVGTNLAVPLSLGMKDSSAQKSTTVKRRKTDGSATLDELQTEGLPPNAVDEDGNILVTDHDILCGRGGLTNHHKGNKRFRDVVTLHRPDYVRAPKIQKPSVARVIVRAIRNGDPPGRFLRKDDKTGQWIDIGDKKAAEKTSQALREKTTEEREKLKTDPSSSITKAAMSLLPATTDFLAAAGAMMAGIPASPTVVVAAAAKADEKPAAESKDEEDKTKEEAEVKLAEEVAPEVEDVHEV